MNPQEIITQIKSDLQKVHENDFNSSREWTKEFKKALCKLGKENKFLVSPDEDSNEPEWLFDLIWYTIDKNQNISGLKMACEIEWKLTNEELLLDFQKLTVVDADIRLFIFQYCSDLRFNEIKNLLNSAAKYTFAKNYSYILIGTSNNSPEIKLETLSNQLQCLEPLSLTY